MLTMFNQNFWLRPYLYSSVTGPCFLLPWNPVLGCWFSAHSFQKDEVTVTDGAYSSLLLIALGFHTQADECVQGMHEAKILQVNM